MTYVGLCGAGPHNVSLGDFLARMRAEPTQGVGDDARATAVLSFRNDPRCAVFKRREAIQYPVIK